jgi:hypothetical protein
MPLILDVTHAGQRFRFPNVRAYDFSPEVLRSFFDASDSIPVPLVFDLHFKASCQLRCKFCYTEAGKDDYWREIERLYPAMGAEDLQEALRQYAKLGGHTVIILSIGEPLINVERFLTLARIAKELGLRVLTFTNMLTVSNSETARRLRDAEVSLLLKLNHFDPQINDQIAGRPGLYKYGKYQGQMVPEQLITILKAYEGRSDLIALSSDILRQNRDNILEISRWAYDGLGVAHFRKHLYYYGWAKENRDMIGLSDEEIKDISEAIYAFDGKYGYEYPVGHSISDAYSFDTRRFINNSSDRRGFPLRVFSHYICGFYHSSGGTIPTFGFNSGISLALKDPTSGSLNLSKLLEEISKHVFFFRGVSRRIAAVECELGMGPRDLPSHGAAKSVLRAEARGIACDLRRYLASHEPRLTPGDRLLLQGYADRAASIVEGR